MSANLDPIDLNSDVVSVEPEDDVHGVSILEPTVKLRLSDAETLTDSYGQTQKPVVDQVRNFEEANDLKGVIVDGLGNGDLERETESVDRGITLETEIGSVERESNTVVDVSSGVVLQVIETSHGEVEENHSGQVKKEVKVGIPSSSAFEDSIQVQNAGNSGPLPGVVDVLVKEASANFLLPLQDVGEVCKEVTSDCTGFQAMELDDQANTSEVICQENDDNNKSGALNLVVDLNPYVSIDGNDLGNVNVKVSASKLEFSVSDLVWGKVRSHPWWPGQIFDPSDSSEKAKKYFKRDSYLIAYFGDQTFAWNEPSMIKPFRSHFSQMEKQNNSEEFHYAIDCALDEVSRRVEFGLSCRCICEYSKINTQIIVNAGIREDSSRRVGGDSFSGADAFEPAKLVDYIKALGLLPFGLIDRLEFVTTQAQLLAFCRWKGFSQLPEFQILGTLLLSDTEIAQLVPVEGKCCSELNENPGAEDKDDKHASSGKVESKCLDHSTPKRKYISGDNVYPRKKEKSLADLMAERGLSVPNGKSGLGIRATNKVTSPSSGKKRKAVDSIYDDSLVNHSKILSSSGGGINPSSQPKRTYRVGDSILRVASQLFEPTPISKSVNGVSPDSAIRDESNEKSLSRKSQGKKLFQIENSSFYEMVSQLCLVARDPMDVCSFLKSVVSFFVEFRNSVCLEHLNSLQHKSSFLEFLFSDNIGKESSNSETETCESEYAKDSCLQDMIIQSVPKELPSPENQNGAVDMPPESTTKKVIPLIELQPTAQSSPNLDSEHQGAGEILDMEAMKPVDHSEENCNDHSPTALILNFTGLDSIPSESNLNKIFSRFGRVKESETEVLKKSNRVKVVFYRRDDAETAFSSAGKYSIFGPSLVSYRLKYMPFSRSKSSPKTTKSSKKNANSVEENTT
ncbi:hypothetical protein P3X46_009733 [Hevea brasiliensis]|uniref:PWWP domain-containing protein n=1 Tax=Hevea brasiliensis TaxID=3981 RepID=A0ABQ9MMY1_HEVBR|nr:PWWP domain-containing protein 5 isoform X1 [Hevea brasiliensis]KAJ9181620.1 hypothetical protein P3X46_009733 [Hevea brasiliensis]KAJ9181621.1 hypothetical protein P3X46_009733 [Hevea brasiliensis]